MSNEVIFNEGGSQMPRSVAQKSGITRMIMKYSGGTITNERQAGYALLVIAVLMILAAIIIFSTSGTNIVPLKAPATT